MFGLGKNSSLKGIDFVILASQRTGSNMLVSVLDAYPGLRCHGELFRKLKVGKQGALKLLNQLPEKYEDGDYRDAKYASYLHQVRKLSDKDCFFGFKLMLNQAPEARRVIIRNPGIKIILLHRENLLAVHSSNLIARFTGQGNVKDASMVKKEKVEFDEARFTRFCENHRAKYDEARRDLNKYASGRFLDISYLEICRPEGMLQVESFLGVSRPPDPVAPATAKRNSSRIVDRFSNPDTVIDYLQRSGHTAWMEEVLQ